MTRQKWCIVQQLTADLVGELIFSDTDFVNRLSVEKPNIFQKLFEEIKYMCKIVTAGSQEAKKLEEVKRAFEKAYKENGKEVNDNKYSLGEIIDDNNNSYGVGVHLDSTFLDNLSSDERVELIKEYVKELGGQTFGAYDANGNKVDVTIATSKRFKNKSGKKVSANKDLQTKFIKNETKQEAIALIDELVSTATQDGSAPPNYSHDWLDNNGKNDWEYWTTYIQDKNKTIWEATLNIANSSNGEKILYDISPIKKVGKAVKSATSPTINSISQNTENTTPTYSISEDSQGRKLSNEQMEFFKESKVRDENGALIPVYHGTKADFSVFEPNKGEKRRLNMLGAGNYFAIEESKAEKYGERVIPAYLNLKNPYRVNNRMFADKLE